MNYTMFTSNNCQVLPSCSLPFHVHGTGVYQTTNTHFVKKRGILNQFVEVLWGISGVGEVILFDRKFQIHPDDVFYYLPGEDHESRALSDNWAVRWLCLEGALAEAVILSYRYPRLQSAISKYPEVLFQEIEHCLSCNGFFELRKTCSIVLDILARTGGEYHDGNSVQIAKRCVNMIKERLHDSELNVCMLCEELDISRTTLTRLFKEETGVSPGRYILNLRLHKATAQLRSTNLAVSDIAHKCGFSDLRSFCRFIKRATGEAPLQLRKAAQQ
ncbi:MAG: AraC family transcriptional regulator [Victivallales bacterium]|nr:AraC family transcriptional regulator [Victivallales bacterium]